MSQKMAGLIYYDISVNRSLKQAALGLWGGGNGACCIGSYLSLPESQD